MKLGICWLAARLPAVLAQNAPHLAYVLPAGGRQGTTFQVKAGGQFLPNVSAVYVSGSGVQATVVDYARPMNAHAGHRVERPDAGVAEAADDRRRPEGNGRYQGQAAPLQCHQAHQPRACRNRYAPGHHRSRRGARQARITGGHAARVVESAGLLRRPTAGIHREGIYQRGPTERQSTGSGANQPASHRHAHHPAGHRQRTHQARSAAAPGPGALGPAVHARRGRPVPVPGASRPGPGDCGQRARIDPLSGRRGSRLVSGRSDALRCQRKRTGV